MERRHVIVVGDTTTAGGETTEGLTDVRVACQDGLLRPLVCVGHAVTCGGCGPTRVAEGAPYFGHLRAAYDGAALACGHRLVSRRQPIVTIEVPRDE